jgi:type II secretory pathway component PulL
MKKTKINLLIDRVDYQKTEAIFYWLRLTLVVFALLLLGTLIYFSVTFIRQNNTINSLLEQKKTLLQSLQNRQDDEAKVTYLEKKYRALKEFLKDDAYSLPYYNLLNLALVEATESAQLKLFQISKNREVEFTVTFNNFSDLMNFFKFIESEKFLKNFENIVLKSFSTQGSDTNEKENYELAFTGRFVPINESKN